MPEHEEQDLRYVMKPLKVVEVGVDAKHGGYQSQELILPLIFALVRFVLDVSADVLESEARQHELEPTHTFGVVHERAVDVEMHLVFVAVLGERTPILDVGCGLVLVRTQQDWPFTGCLTFDADTAAMSAYVHAVRLTSSLTRPPSELAKALSSSRSRSRQARRRMWTLVFSSSARGCSLQDSDNGGSCWPFPGEESAVPPSYLCASVDSALALLSKASDERPLSEEALSAMREKRRTATYAHH